MSDKPHFPKITAKSVEEFKFIEDKLKELPQKILDQIDVANNHFKITCRLYELFDSGRYIYLPDYTTQIATGFTKEDGLEVAIYANDFLFKIEWKHKRDAVVNYQFIECKPKQIITKDNDTSRI